MRRLATWLAILAMALQALWPLIAKARPATLVPVCTVGGVTHYVDVPDGRSPADEQHQHCAFCFVGAALAARPVIQGFDAFSFPAPVARQFEAKSFSAIDADARAPPALP